jgi:hypothetical protein
MKNRKLLIPVLCTTRKFYLHSPPPAETIGTCDLRRQPLMALPELYFEAPEQRRLRPQSGSLAQIIESFWTDAGRGGERLKLRNDIPIYLSR